MSDGGEDQPAPAGPGDAPPRVPPLVADDEDLHRAVPRENVAADGHVHYMAFYSASDDEDEVKRVSFDRARYRPLAETMTGRTEHALARIAAGAARRIPGIDPPLDVVSRPENGNEAHAELVYSGTISKKQMKTRICGLIGKAVTVVDPWDA